jgi:hypothetical protein
LFTTLHAFAVCLQHKMPYRRTESPPVVHPMLQTNIKSVQKNYSSRLQCKISKKQYGK